MALQGILEDVSLPGACHGGLGMFGAFDLGSSACSRDALVTSSLQPLTSPVPCSLQ